MTLGSYAGAGRVDTMVSPLRAVRRTNRRLPAVDNWTRLHLTLQRLLKSLILRQVQGHVTERMVVSAGSIFDMRQPVGAR